MGNVQCKAKLFSKTSFFSLRFQCHHLVAIQKNNQRGPNGVFFSNTYPVVQNHAIYLFVSHLGFLVQFSFFLEFPGVIQRLFFFNRSFLSTSGLFKYKSWGGGKTLLEKLYLPSPFFLLSQYSVVVKSSPLQSDCLGSDPRSVTRHGAQWCTIATYLPRVSVFICKTGVLLSRLIRLLWVFDEFMFVQHIEEGLARTSTNLVLVVTIFL